MKKINIILIAYFLTLNNAFSQETPPNPGSDQDKNWVSTINYDVSGNTKAKGIKFFNDGGKLIETQAWDPLTQKIWTTKTYYDQYNREALKTLAAPQNIFGINSAFIADELGGFFNNIDYDLPLTIENPSAINDASILGAYYSENNVTNIYQDVTSYPYAKNVYSKLNPEKRLKVLGGNKIDGEWKQSYTFSMPAGQELSQLGAFGEVNYNNLKTIKTISRDVHGTEVVVFTDTNGKTLAAARTGGNSNPDSTIEIGAQGFVDVHVPYGTTGFTINGVSGITTEVYDLITEQNTTPLTSILPNGFYRVSITNLESYNPDTNPVAVTYHDNYYDYSLNEYDEAGRLKAAYQPYGATKAQKPVTTYSYNALGQLLSTTSPDEGTAEFKYRKDGQIRFSQNTKQLADTEFSYTNYDDLGRPIESGVATGSFASLNPDTSSITTSLAHEKQKTTYDTLEIADAVFLANINSDYANPTFLADNVAKTKNENTTTYYSYDIYGRVKWLVQDIMGLGTKTIDYSYDPITGAVTEVDFQKDNSLERFKHKYTYDATNNSLVRVETSTDGGSTYTTHANYNYYETGALKRINIAQGLQGVDYVYNLNGQLKSINHPSSIVENDPGNDSLGTNGVIADLFGMQIDYHSNDFTRPLSNISTPNYGEDQYNGNIKGVRWKNKVLDNTEQTYSYYYNKNNWLTDAIYGQYANTEGDDTAIDLFEENIYDGISKSFNATNSITLSPGFHGKPGLGDEVTAKIVLGTPSAFRAGDYNVFGITYDANGNIGTLNRNKDTYNNQNKMDQLSYVYDPEKPNQLLRVDDPTGEVIAGTDIGDQDGNNYEYNSIGQLVKNNEEGMEYIYNASGLVTEIKKDNVPLVKFFYNDRGHRIRKEYDTGAYLITTHYVKDVSGNAIAIYNDPVGKGATSRRIEYGLYGSNRLGVRKISIDGTGKSTTIIYDNYLYQLTDHLGNVRAVTGRANDGTAMAIVSATDYYPGGMAMPGRSLVGGYRYGYQGEYSEKDEETGLNVFELRMYDSRINRWISPDPAQQYPSPYLGMGNNWMNGTDPDGALFVIDDFLFGFIGGLFQNRDNFSNPDASRFGNAISNGSRMASNSANIWASLGRTDPDKTFGGKILQVASKLTWELPQSLGGVLSGHLVGYANGIDKITNYRGATLIKTNAWKGIGFIDDDGVDYQPRWGFTVGSVITTSHTERESLIQHEFGHYLTSRLQGPLFIPANILSPVSAFIGEDFHASMPWERWADKKSHRFFKNHN